MRNYALVFLLLSTVAWGQSKPAAMPQGQTPAPAAGDDDSEHPIAPAPASAANIGPKDPVLTIKGLCADAPTKANPTPGSDCNTVITREQFEKIARAIQPSLSPVVKRQLIALYPKLLVMTREAEIRGIDKEEHFQQVFDFARMQILSQQLTRRIQQEASKVSEADIQDYYKKNPDLFREYTVERIYIPLEKQQAPPSQKLSDEAEKAREKDAQDAMIKLAADIQKRAANGESFEKLQKEAYEVAGLKSNPPNASMGKIRSNGLPPSHGAVFKLKVGEVSQVMSDANGHHVYKIDSTNMESMTDAKVEIHNALQSQRLHSMMDKLQAPFSTDINEAYFGPSTTGASDDKPESGAMDPLAPKRD